MKKQEKKFYLRYQGHPIGMYESEQEANNMIDAEIRLNAKLRREDYTIKPVEN